jgi:hypothetical protein
VRQRRTLLRAFEQEADEARDVAGGASEALTADGLDGEILRLLVPAILAVFLDPAMALIDTGEASSCKTAPCASMCFVCQLVKSLGESAVWGSPVHAPAAKSC